MRRPRCTPPMPPVANIAIPARCAARIVALTVVEARARAARSGPRSREPAFATVRSGSASRSSSARSAPMTIAAVLDRDRRRDRAGLADRGLGRQRRLEVVGDRQALRDEARLEGDDAAARVERDADLVGDREEAPRHAGSSSDPALRPGHARHGGRQVGGRRHRALEASGVGRPIRSAARSAINPALNASPAPVASTDRSSAASPRSRATDRRETRPRRRRVGDDGDRCQPVGEHDARAPRRPVRAADRARLRRVEDRRGAAAATGRRSSQPATSVEASEHPSRTRRGDSPGGGDARGALEKEVARDDEPVRRRPGARGGGPCASGTRWLSIVRSRAASRSTTTAPVADAARSTTSTPSAARRSRRSVAGRIGAERARQAEPTGPGGQGERRRWLPVRPARGGSRRARRHRVAEAAPGRRGRRAARHRSR